MKLHDGSLLWVLVVHTQFDDPIPFSSSWGKPRFRWHFIWFSIGHQSILQCFLSFFNSCTSEIL